jgi:hypothetical protein
MPLFLKIGLEWFFSRIDVCGLFSGRVHIYNKERALNWED